MASSFPGERCSLLPPRSYLLPLTSYLFLAGCAHFESRPLAPEATAAHFEARTLDSPDLKAFVEKNLQPGQWPPQQWDVDTLTWAAIFYHPSMDVARAQWGVAKAAQRTAGQRPNPSLGLAPQYTANAESGVSPWVLPLTVDVPIETAGKRRFRMAAADHAAEASRLNLASAAWQVRSHLRAALLDCAVSQRRVVQLQSILDVQQRIVDLLNGRVAAGEIAMPEGTASRVAALKTRADLIEARRQVEVNRAALAEALGLPLKALEGSVMTFDLAIRPESFVDLRSGEVRGQALHRRADLLSLLATYAASQSTLQLEIARQYPDVTLGPGYEYDQGSHKWGLNLGVELPAFNRNQGPIAEAEARRTEAAAQFLALQAKVIGQIDQALAGLAAVRDGLRQMETLRATQQQQVESMEATVKAGGADQLDLATARLEVQVIDLAGLEAVYKAQQALGQLEDAIQVPFKALSLVEQDGRARNAKENKP